MAPQQKDVDKSERIRGRPARMVAAGSLDLQIQPEGMGLAQPGVEIHQHLQGGYQQQGARFLRGLCGRAIKRVFRQYSVLQQ